MTKIGSSTMTDAKVELVARAISVPEHHTTWDLLTEAQKDLYRMQADYALKAMAVIESGQKHTDLITGLPVEDWAEDMIARRKSQAVLEQSDAVMGEDIAKSVIAEANNSLFGSQSYFVTTAEGRVAGSVGVSEPPDKYHLARPIEALKSESRAAWRALRQLEEELPNAALGTLRAALKRSTPIAPVQDDDAEWLRQKAKLARVSRLNRSPLDAERYERIASRLSRQARG